MFLQLIFSAMQFWVKLNINCEAVQRNYDEIIVSLNVLQLFRISDMRNQLLLNCNLKGTAL